VLEWSRTFLTLPIQLAATRLESTPSRVSSVYRSGNVSSSTMRLPCTMAIVAPLTSKPFPVQARPRESWSCRPVARQRQAARASLLTQESRSTRAPIPTGTAPRHVLSAQDAGSGRGPAEQTAREARYSVRSAEVHVDRRTPGRSPRRSRKRFPQWRLVTARWSVVTVGGQSRSPPQDRA
jgi:hypothetical protein